MHLCDWIRKLLIVSSSDFLDSSFAVKSHSDGLIGLYKLIQLFGEFLILHSDYPNMVVKGINLNLEIAIIIKESWIAIPGTFEFLSHVHDLVLFGSDLGLKILDWSCKLNVPWALSIDSLLKINILISVFFFECLQVIELILETDDLILKLDDLTFTIDELGLLALEIHGLAVNQLVEIINSRKLLADIVFEGSSLGSKVIWFLGL